MTDVSEGLVEPSEKCDKHKGGLIFFNLFIFNAFLKIIILKKKNYYSLFFGHTAGHAVS